MAGNFRAELQCSDSALILGGRYGYGPFMRSVLDVAAYIVQKLGPVTAMKLQKLVYYSQAWSLVWDEKPLFREKVEAWANGPVVRRLFDIHKGQFKVKSVPGGDPARLKADERETVDAVLNFYGRKSSQWLSDLTHLEAPWRNARAGLPDGTRGTAEITHASMADYYGSLDERPQAAQD
jgi:uncharacterized phage-associated protein